MAIHALQVPPHETHPTLSVIFWHCVTTHVADLRLPLLPLSTIPLELSSSDLELTIYCDNLVGTVPYLRHFAALVVSQTLVKHQIFKEYLFRTYPS